ncbi:MAG: hypothetical protein LUQ30_02960 [Methanothrix sp.]|nr:hypothetical protein [Methanothrix sp.]
MWCDLLAAFSFFSCLSQDSEIGDVAAGGGVYRGRGLASAAGLISSWVVLAAVFSVPAIAFILAYSRIPLVEDPVLLAATFFYKPLSDLMADNKEIPVYMRSSMVIRISEIDRAEDTDWHQLEAFIYQGIACCRQPIKVPFGTGLQIADEHAIHVFGPAWGIPPSLAPLARQPALRTLGKVHVSICAYM